MKKTKISVGIFLILMLAACRHEAANPPEQPGFISILISNDNSRDLTLNNSLPASENSDTFEIIIYNGTESFSTVLTTDEFPESGPITLSVSAGTYTILVLAGCGSSTDSILLGSAHEPGIEVISESITNVSLTLNSISHQLTLPESVQCSTDYTIAISGDTNNPLLQITAGGSSMENKPYIEKGEVADNIYLACVINGSDWTGSILLPAPALPDSSWIEFFGSNIKLVDPVHSRDEELGVLGNINWQWLNLNNIPESLKSEVFRSIEFAATDTGVNITIDWS
ncbi:MAG: hypothetical protein JEY99_05135 [Spirochaetales bacterium]|nr:hypothetical protein [Spirochaetales bacterium]